MKSIDECRALVADARRTLEAEASTPRELGLARVDMSRVIESSLRGHAANAFEGFFSDRGASEAYRIKADMLAWQAIIDEADELRDAIGRRSCALMAAAPR